MIKRIFILLCFVLYGITHAIYAQDMVYLEHSETLNFDESISKDAQILRGNVRFRHDSALMFCDSAYFYDKENSLDAFGHVRLVQGDSLHGFADRMYYDGNQKIVRFRDNVTLIHKNTTLTTDSLNYNRISDLAYYFTGGSIADSLNTLTSVWGQYHPTSSQALFHNNVHLDNANFNLQADTLLYNTDTKIANIVGPTTIVYEGQTTILSTSGWYNTENEHSMLLQHSLVIHTDGMSMTGDTIYYDKPEGFCQIYGNMELVDSTNFVTLYGNYGQMYEENHKGYATDSAMMLDWSDSTAYSYLHADTLFTENIVIDDIAENRPLLDTVNAKDSTYHRVRAHHGVRIYRSDVQAVCDSLVYRSIDSLITMYYDPLCWNAENQFSADTLFIQLKNGSIDYMHGVGAAFATQRKTDIYFNQMSGNELYAYIVDGELSQIDVNGNAETIFYPQEENDTVKDFIGLNKTESSYIKIYIKEKEIDHVLFTTQTNGIIYPLDQIPEGMSYLTGYFWATNGRPVSPEDIFSTPKRTLKPTKNKISATQRDTSINDGKKGEGPKRRNGKHQNKISID